MFFFWWLVSGAIVIFEGYLAYFDGLLTREQARQRQARARGMAKVANFMGHGGMWGDFFLVSPIASWMFTYYRDQWTTGSLVKAAGASLLISILLLMMWVKNSRELIEPFARFGKATFNGYVHAGYMFIHLTVIFLFFFHTPNVGREFVWVAVVGLGIHISIGLIQPEWNTYRRVSPINLFLVVVAWSLLFWRGWSLTH